MAPMGLGTPDLTNGQWVALVRRQSASAGVQVRDRIIILLLPLGRIQPNLIAFLAARGVNRRAPAPAYERLVD